MSSHLKNYKLVLSIRHLEVHELTSTEESNILTRPTQPVRFHGAASVSVTLSRKHSVQIFLDFTNLDYIPTQADSMLVFLSLEFLFTQLCISKVTLIRYNVEVPSLQRVRGKTTGNSQHLLFQGSIPSALFTLSFYPHDRTVV